MIYVSFKLEIPQTNIYYIQLITKANSERCLSVLNYTYINIKTHVIEQLKRSHEM